MPPDDGGTHGGGAFFIFLHDVAAGVGRQAARLPDETFARDPDQNGAPESFQFVEAVEEHLVVLVALREAEARIEDPVGHAGRFGPQGEIPEILLYAFDHVIVNIRLVHRLERTLVMHGNVAQAKPAGNRQHARIPLSGRNIVDDETAYQLIGHQYDGGPVRVDRERNARVLPRSRCKNRFQPRTLRICIHFPGAGTGRTGTQVEDVETPGQQLVCPPAERIDCRRAGRRIERIGIEVDDPHHFRHAAFHKFRIFTNRMQR